MEELTTALPPPRHRPRRHRRKASDSATYGDVFGGGPRFEAPSAGVPYSDVFGGVAASCSIPCLDLPPAAAGRDDGAGKYGEIFARFDFGEFAAPYEDVFAEEQGMAEEIASWSGSSRSSIRKESGELDAEPSLLYQHYPNVVYGQQFDEEQFSPISLPSGGEQQFSMSYNKATRGRLDDLVEITTCMVEPSISYVVDSCNLSNDSATNHVPAMENDTLANGENKEMSPSPLSASSESVAHEQQHVSSCPPTSENQEQQHVSSYPPTSENLYEDEKDQRRSSTHSASSEEVPSPDYPFLRVSNTSIQTPPIKVQPPSMLPSNLLDKKESKANRDSEVNPNSAAAAAIKEAMDFAEARLKAAKELMERKGDSFKLRKRSGHHRGTKSAEIKEEKSSEEVYAFEEKQTFRRLGGEETNYDDLAFLDKHRDSSEVKMADCYHEEKGVLPPGKSQQMMESGSKLDQLGNWASAAGFYDMVSHDQKCTTNTAACGDDNGLTANLFTKHSQSEKAKEGATTGDLGKYGKLSAGNDIKELRMQCVNPREDDAAFMGGEHKASTPPDDNGLTANLFTKHQSEKANEGVTTGDLESYGNLSDGNDIKELRMQHVNPREDDVASMEGEHKGFTPPEVSLREERAVYQETTDSHINKYVGKSNSLKGCDNDGIFEISSINGIPVPDISSLSLEACISGGHANDKKNYCDTEETPPVGKPNNENNNEEGPEIPCAETPCTSVKNQISDEHLEVPYINETETSQVKVATLEEPAEYYETHCSQKMSSTVHREAETCDKDKVFSFVGEPCLQNEKEKITEVPSEIIIHEEMKKFETEEEAGGHNEAKIPTLEEPVEYYETQCFQDMLSTVHREGETYEKDELFSFADEARLQNVSEKKTEVPLETLIHDEVKKFETEENTGPHEDFQEEDVYWDAGSSEKEASDTPRSLNANTNDEAEVLNVFVEDCELMESNVGTCGSFAEDSDQLPESQVSLSGPKDLENKMDGVENLVSHGNLREAKQNLSEDSEKTLVEEMLNHDKESQTSMEPGTNKGLNDVYAEIIAKNHREGSVLHSETEVITDDYSDYTMKMSTCSKDLQSSFSEACTSMPHLSQGAESVSAPTSGESTPFVENLEDCRKSDNEISTLRYTSLEGKTTVDKMQEKDGKDRKLSLDLKDQSFAEDSASKFAQRSRKEIPDAQRVEGRDDIRKLERENENEASLYKDKERECKMEKEQSKEKARRELEEEKERERDRERERAKDRLAVQRATREAHERAFAEARATAERIALERITSSRQKASAEARGKDKASDEPATEKASREARIKAERAAVERATAEARERAIGKAKAAADAKERIEKVRSSFKDSCKATNQETQFQKTASNNYGSSDSCNQEAEYESALRHKARSERHQRTAERAEKALAEKNMRDMLAQREQAEKHRLAEFLDPEVKRWSNGKEGNLRALLSTLQYILGSDSGWQSVPLTDLITAAGVKKAYRKATLCVHPDKVQQRGATIRQKYICEKVFDLLKEAWNKFNSGER